MKKVTLFFAALALSLASFAQPVADNATIPVSVTLNSILRLNVTAGGNIEFAVNTLTQYTSGIENTQGTTTKFTVASSMDFDVEMYAETNGLTGTDLASAAGSMSLNNIGYCVSEQGSGSNAVNWDITGVDADNVAPFPAVRILTASPGSVSEIISAHGTGNSAGDITKNIFSVHWSCGTSPIQTLGGVGTLLSQNLAADRYSTNVFLVLRKAN